MVYSVPTYVVIFHFVVYDSNRWKDPVKTVSFLCFPSDCNTGYSHRVNVFWWKGFLPNPIRNHSYFYAYFLPERKSVDVCASPLTIYIGIYYMIIHVNLQFCSVFSSFELLFGNKSMSFQGFPLLRLVRGEAQTSTNFLSG